MFLLIPNVVAPYRASLNNFKFHYVSINSTKAQDLIDDTINFKFHYVSINSRSAVPTNAQHVNFKFHYVSINSYSIRLQVTTWMTLNSIMFLLIHKN